MPTETEERKVEALTKDEIAELRAVHDSIGAAGSRLEDLGLDTRNFNSAAVVEDGWLLEGYTDSMMVHLEELVLDVITLRCNATASISERDQRIAAAFGRDID